MLTRLRVRARDVMQRCFALFVYDLFNECAVVCDVSMPARGMEYPRCSTALDGSLDEISLDDDALRFVNSDEDCENDGTVVNASKSARILRRKHSPLLKLKEVIESLRLDSSSPPQESDSDYTSLTASPSASIRLESESTAQRSDLVGLEPFLEDLNVGLDDGSSIDHGNGPCCEPESDIITQFRQFGLRFIRKPHEYSFCECRIPPELLQYHDNLSEVACEEDLQALPLCLQVRWAELRADFNVDVFGDLQFQDFLLDRQQRGPHHAMVHFGNLFANIGYDGVYWYWTLVGDTETPFIEDKFRNKDNFVNSLRTIARHHMRTRKGKGPVLCPRISPDAHVFVRAAHDEQCRATIEAEDDVTLSEGRSIEELSFGGPRSLSYLKLFTESYYATPAIF